MGRWLVVEAVILAVISLLALAFLLRWIWPPR